MISKYRPKSHIVAVTFNEHVYRGLALSWGVYPRLATPVSNTDEMFDLAVKESLASGVAKQGDLIIITAGVPVTESGTTNVMKIQLIGEKVVKAKVLAANLLLVKQSLLNPMQKHLKKQKKAES